MRWLPFLTWSTLGTAGWNALLTFAGMALGTRYQLVAGFIGPVSIVVIIGIAVVYVWRVATWKDRDRNRA